MFLVPTLNDVYVNNFKIPFDLNGFLRYIFFTLYREFKSDNLFKLASL